MLHIYVTYEHTIVYICTYMVSLCFLMGVFYILRYYLGIPLKFTGWEWAPLFPYFFYPSGIKFLKIHGFGIDLPGISTKSPHKDQTGNCGS